MPDYLATSHGLGGELADKMPPLQRDILTFFEDNKRASLRIATALHNYVALADRVGDPRQGGLLGDTPPTREQLWQKAKSAEEALQSGERAGVDPLIIEAFGPDVQLDEYNLPVIPRSLPDGHPLLVPTATEVWDETGRRRMEFKENATIPAESILVQRGFLTAGTVPRKQLHAAIKRLFIKFGNIKNAEENKPITPLPDGERPTIYASGGGGGAGKSTILALRQKDGAIDTTHAITVNADDIKELIPEFAEFIRERDGRGAAVVHEESSHLAKSLMQMVVATRRFDIIFDATLSNAEKTRKRFTAWQQKDFRVYLIGVTINPHVAMVRASIRAKKKGRWVASAELAKAHQKFNAALLSYLPLVDGYSIYDNTPPKPHLVAEKASEDSQENLVNPQYFAIIESRGKDENALRSQASEEAVSALAEGSGRVGDSRGGQGETGPSVELGQGSRPGQEGLSSARRAGVLLFTPQQQALLDKAFGPGHPKDEYGAPFIPHILPAGHPLLVHTADKSHADMSADHVLVKAGYLPAGRVKRAQLRRAMLAWFLKDGTPLPEDQQPTVYIMAGGPGAGKTSVVLDLIAEGKIPAGCVRVSADDFRSLIPEMRQFIGAGDGRGSEFTDREAASLVPRLIQILTSPERTRTFNIVVDSLMASEASKERIPEFHAKGFKTHLLGVSLEPLDAVVRTFIRASGSGRWVRPMVTLAGHRGANANLETLLSQAGEADVVDNTPAKWRYALKKRGPYGEISIDDPTLWATIKQRGKDEETRAAQVEIPGAGIPSAGLDNGRTDERRHTPSHPDSDPRPGRVRREWNGSNFLAAIS